MVGNLHETDVLIVGAGPTGLLLANLLGATGVPCIIVERNPTTVQEPRAVSLDDESLRAMQAAGLADEVTAITARGYGSIYRGPSGHIFATVKPTERDYGHEKRNAFQQPELEELLRRAINDRPRVEAFFGATVSSFEQNGEIVVAQIRTADRSQQIAARYMVACDGGRSTIRHALGIEMTGSTFAEPWLIVDLASTKNRTFHTEVYCDPKRPAITLPGPNGIRRYEFMLRDGEATDGDPNEDFARQLLSQVGPDRDEPLRRVQVYTFHARVAERWRDGRIFLAGDAAHLTPPFAGQGMNSGLRDAHNLAWKLAEAAKTTGTCEELLDSYEIERKPHAWSLIELAMRMGTIMMPRSHLRGALIRGAFRLLGLYPPARDYVSQMRYKPKPRFERGLIWPDGRLGAASAIGQMIPQPVVETPDRQRLLLDEVMPDKPVLLVHSPAPDQALASEVRRQFLAAGVAVIGITPEDTNAVPADFPIVRDHGRLFSRAPFRDYLGHVLLVRRDRYAAAATSAEHASDLLEKACRLRCGS